MVKISGQQRHSARLKNMASPKARRFIEAALYAGGQIIEIEAEISITSGSVSGAGHVPSRPGEPPNADTRLLDTSIETTVVRGSAEPTVHVTSNAPYSAALEFGTSKVAERPYMRPATQKKRREVIDLVRKARAKSQTMV